MAQDMDALKKLKIARNTYILNVKRKFSPTRHFLIKRSTADTPLAKFLERLMGKDKSFGKAGMKKRPKAGAGPKPRKKIKVSTLLFAGGAILLLFLLVFAFLNFSIQSSLSYAPQPPAPAPKYSASLVTNTVDYGILTYGSSTDGLYQAYYAFDYLARGASSIDASALLFPSPPTRQIFILRYEMKGADIYPQFRKALGELLLKDGYSVADISPSQVRHLPPGSTLIIPTGYLPEFFLEDAPAGSTNFPKDEETTPLITSLVASGTTVVYIGHQFDQVLLPTGQISNADEYALRKTTLLFDSGDRPGQTPDFILDAPLYTASTRDKDARASRLWGVISQIDMGKGSLLLLPEDLDGAWPSNGKLAAQEIARLVTLEPYRSPLAQAHYYIKNMKRNETGRTYLYLSPSKSPGGWLRVKYLVRDRNNLTRGFYEDIYVRKVPRGDIYIEEEPIILPIYLGGKPADLFVTLREPSTTPVKLYFELVANNTVMERHELEAGKTQPTISKKASLRTNVGPGRYIIRLVDESRNIYAATAIDVVGVKITSPRDVLAGMGKAFKSGQFNFSFSINGNPAKVSYVKVWTDKTGPQEFRDVSQISYQTKYKFRGAPPPGIAHNFYLDFGGGYIQTIQLVHVIPRGPFDNPLFQFLTVISVIFGAVGFCIRRPEKRPFSLDIPDFPPRSVIKIPLPTSVVLRIFDQVNLDYSWKYMPLKPSEIKGSFRKLNYKGKPIAIGDYNLERILDKLKEKGLVEESIGYFGLARWTKESGKPIKFRAFYRRVRDLCVTNAIRFSKLGALPYCDVKLLVGRTEYFLHFFTGDDRRVISRALETIPLGSTWILFEDEYLLEKFKSRLQTEATAPLALKMELHNKRAKLVTLGDLPKLFKTLKLDSS